MESSSPSSREPYDSTPTADGSSAGIADTLDRLSTSAESVPPIGVELTGPLLAGARIDDLRIMRQLGRGGMGEVYLARDTVLGRRVALKRLRGAGTGAALTSLMTEARALARINHPHIVTIYAVGTFAGSPYLALEYLEGEDLGARLDRKRPTIAQGLRWAAAIADGLGAAHAAGVLHRDLKPGNVMLPSDGRLRVVDFGLARSIEREQKISGRRGISGTPGYMAPEQWRGEACTPATDVWALGVIIYEMIIGRRPFEGTDELDVREETVGSTVAPPLELDDDPRWVGVAELVARCLAKDPDARPTVAACLGTLGRTLRSEPGQAVEGDGPFRGLDPFTERQAGLFFGRDAELSAAVERLSNAPAMLVLGPSGAGKSSFVHAGMVPRLREQGRWHVVTVRPGVDPFRSAARRLAEGTNAPLVAPDDLRAHPAALGQALREAARRVRASVLFVVDQLEETFALAADPRDPDRFMWSLSMAADDPVDPVRVVATMRDGFVGRVATSPGRALLQRLMVLAPPSSAALARIVRQPLAVVGYRFEDPAMADEMVAAVDGSPAALPLLGFAAHKLWEGRDADRRVLTRAALRELGGVEGVLARHADGVLAGFADTGPVRALCLRMVTPDGTRRVLERGALLDGLGPDAETALDRLVDARLVTARRGETGIEIELTHESLITQWDRLARWLDASREDRETAAEVEAAAALWEQRGRRASELWDGDALHEARRALDRIAEPPASVRAFVEAGEAHLRRLRRRRRVLLGALIGALATVALSLAIANRRANVAREDAQQQAAMAERARDNAARQARRAASQEAAALRASARAALAGDRPLEARARLRAAMEIEDHPSGRALWQAVRESPVLWRHTIDSTVQNAVLDPTGSRLAIAADDGLLRVFDLRDGREERLRNGSDNLLDVLWPSPDLLFAGTASSGLLRIDPTTRRVTTVPGTEGSTTSGLGRIGDGSLVFTVDKTLRRCPMPCRAPVIVEDMDRRAFWLETAPTAERLLYNIGPVDTRLVDLATGTTQRFDGGEQHMHRPGVFVDDDTVLIGGLPRKGDLGLARRTEGRFGTPVPIWLDEAGNPATMSLRTLSYERERGMVLAGDLQGGVWVGGVDSPPRLVGHNRTSVVYIARTHDGSIVSVSLDGEIILWRMPPPPALPRVEPVGTSGVIKLDVGRSGRVVTMVGRIATEWSADGTGLRELDNPTPYAMWGVRAMPGSRRILGWIDDDLMISGPGFDQLVRVRLREAPEEPTTPLFAATESLYVVGAEGRIGQRQLLAPSGRPVNGTFMLGQDDATQHAFVSVGPYLGSWPPTAGRPRWFTRVSPNGPDDVALTPDRRLLYGTSWRAGIVVLDPETGAITRPYRRLDATAEGVAALTEGAYVIDDSGRIHHLTGPDDRAPRVVPAHRGAGRRIAEDRENGRLISIGQDHAVRAWDPTLRPIWRTIALVGAPGGPWLATHRGWQGPDGAPPPWHDAPGGLIVADAIAADVGEEITCVIDRDGALRRLRTDGTASTPWPVPGAHGGLNWPRVVEGRGRCLVRHAGRIWLWTTDAPEPVPVGPAAPADPGVTPWGGLVALPDGFAALTADRLLVIGFDGATRAAWPAPDGARAVLRLSDGDWVIGADDGRVERMAVDEEAGVLRRTGRLEGTAPTPVTALFEGPGGTLVAGHADGRLVFWSMDDSQPLRRAHLNGAVTHVARVGPTLVVASEAGDHVEWSVASLIDDHCTLMRAMWAETPAAWRGRVTQAEPPGDHECAIGLDRR